jgi:hypothetical protein
MSSFNTTTLLRNLQADVCQTLVWASQLLSETYQLNIVPHPGKWTIAQVIEHLNTYNNYYLPQIANAYSQYQPIVGLTPDFKTGIIGGYLTKMMEPDNTGQVSNKTKAFKKHIPAVQLNAGQVLQNFIKGQEQFLALLKQAQQYNLNQLRIPMSISPLIRLKLGDILRVLVVHQLRHFIQIRQVQHTIAARLPRQAC